MNGLADFAASLLPGRAPTPVGLRVPAGTDPGLRYAIHRNNVLSSLSRALGESFPVTSALVGAEFFQAMALEYVRARPPRSPVLLEHGAGFAGFVEAFAPAASLPCLGDMARLEWARVEAFHAADAPALGATEFQPWLADPQGLMRRRIVLHPSLRLLCQVPPVLALWQAHQPGHEAGLSQALEQVASGPRGNVAVLRPDAEVFAFTLPAGGREALESLARGERFGEALERAAEVPGFVLDTFVSTLLAQRLASGLSD